jgi:ketosteroid isomerase-like protein
LIWFKSILDNQEIRAALNHHWEATVALEIDRAHDIYHDDVIVEFPQSGERISGKHDIYELRAHYPSKLDSNTGRRKSLDNGKTGYL